MENETGPAADIRGFLRWAITPPQSYAVYLVCLFLVLGAVVLCGDAEAEEGAAAFAAAHVCASRTEELIAMRRLMPPHDDGEHSA